MSVRWILVRHISSLGRSLAFLVLVLEEDRNVYIQIYVKKKKKKRMQSYMF